MSDRPATAPTVPARPGAPTKDAPADPDARTAVRDDDSDDSDRDDSSSDDERPASRAMSRDQLGHAPTMLEDEVARARPALPSMELDVAQAKAEAALFGTAEAVKIGRYRVIERAGAGGMGVVWSAWDPELGRGVALKLASSGDVVARERARDEGRALARLSHPNVVPIYDVLEHDDRVFLVMELVKGKTLRVAAAEQTPAQLVRAYRQAGEGLAAAHHAGLIHRDFKPDNAILGADGRVRVLDFGLAHAVSVTGDESPTIAGTPRYMAPEQRRGDQLTAAVDQYGLCVALGEGLTATGSTPRWVQPILARGSAEAPADRYPSMDALLAALALDPRTRWRRRIAAGAAILAVAGTVGGFTLGRARATEAGSCAGGPALLAPVWGDARRAKIAARLAALPTPYAAEGAPQVVASMDGYHVDWIDLHRRSCQDHRRGELSTPRLTARNACLGQRRTALATVADLAETIPADGLPGLVVAAAQLPDLAECEDDSVLMAAVPPPAPALAPDAGRIIDLMAKVEVDRDAQRLDDAAREAEAAVTAARSLGYRPLMARALLARGRVTLAARSPESDRGAADFAAAIHDALIAGDEPTAVEAYARRVFAVGTSTRAGDPEAGLDLIDAIMERRGAQVTFARALLDSNLASVALARGDRAYALARFLRARATAAAVTGPGALELTVISSGLLAVIDDDALRAEVGRELIATLVARVGSNHPRTLRARIQVATVADDSPRATAALDAACQALIQYHPELGAPIGECGYEILWQAIAAGDRSRGALADAVLGAETHGVSNAALKLARAYRQIVDGDLTAAAATLRALDDRAHPNWWRRLFAADGAAAAGFILRAAGQHAAATLELATAAALYDSVTGAAPSPILARRRRVLAAIAP